MLPAGQDLLDDSADVVHVFRPSGPAYRRCAASPSSVAFAARCPACSPSAQRSPPQREIAAIGAASRHVLGRVTAAEAVAM